MKLLTSKRFADTPEGYFGVFICEDKYPICDILEETYKVDGKDSRILKGEYTMKWEMTATLGMRWVLQGVVGRTGICVHKGNTVIDTKGCILTGHGYSITAGLHGIINSGIAYDSFLKYMQPDVIAKLIIIEV